MSKREITLGEETPGKKSNIQYYRASNMEPGQAVENLKYLESTLDQFDKPAHTFEDAEGNTVVFNSSGMLDKKMKMVNPGTIIDIIYSGSAVMKEGKYKGTKAHVFKVLVNDEAPVKATAKPVKAASLSRPTSSKPAPIIEDTDTDEENEGNEDNTNDW